MHFMKGSGRQFHRDFCHASKVAGGAAQRHIQHGQITAFVHVLDDISPVNRNVIIADRAVTAMERIVRQLQGASLIGAERAKDDMVSRIRSLGSNAAPSDSRKARFDSLPGDIRSVLSHNHRIYYLVEEQRIVVLDVILDAEIHSVE